MKTIKIQILNSLKDLRGSGRFAATHSADYMMPGLCLKGAGDISFPLTEQQAKELIRMARKAPFGKGSETRVDMAVRSAWEIDAGELELRNPQWKLFINKMIHKLKADLGIENYEVSAHLYKLLLYEEGDFFLSHKDSEKEDGMFGTLVVGLPSRYTGGELRIRFDGKEVVADFSKEENEFKINCTAFYADCDHEVKVLTSGYRICLIYNLVQEKSEEKIKLYSNSARVKNLAEILQGHTQDEPYIILLGHQYTPNNFSFNSLKLNDRYKADTLLQAADKAGLYAKLCLVTSFKSGIAEESGWGYYDEPSDENAKMEEVYNEWIEIEHWAASKIPPLKGLNVCEEDLIAAFQLDEGEPLVKESSGYMGNYGPELSHWYHYGAVVIWNKEYNAQHLNQYERQFDSLSEWIFFFNEIQAPTKEEEFAIDHVIFSEMHMPHAKETAVFNVIIDWIIKRWKRLFFMRIHPESFKKMFQYAETKALRKLWEYLLPDISPQTFERLIRDIDLPTVEKLLDVIMDMAAYRVTQALARELCKELPEYIEKLKKPVTFSEKALDDLFWLESNIAADESWAQRLTQSMITQPSREYLIKILAPYLLSGKWETMLSRQLLDFATKYFRSRIENKPQPPSDFTRALPDTNRNVKIWEMLKPFMESPTESVWDYKKSQAERREVEEAINREVLDLKTETIKRGSPHTLRVTKTRAGYEKLYKEWKEDGVVLGELVKWG